MTNRPHNLRCETASQKEDASVIRTGVLMEVFPVLQGALDELRADGFVEKIRQRYLK